MPSARIAVEGMDDIRLLAESAARRAANYRAAAEQMAAQLAPERRAGRDCRTDALKVLDVLTRAAALDRLCATLTDAVPEDDQPVDPGEPATPEPATEPPRPRRRRAGNPDTLARAAADVAAQEAEAARLAALPLQLPERVEEAVRLVDVDGMGERDPDDPAPDDVEDVMGMAEGMG